MGILIDSLFIHCIQVRFVGSDYLQHALVWKDLSNLKQYIKYII